MDGDCTHTSRRSSREPLSAEPRAQATQARVLLRRVARCEASAQEVIGWFSERSREPLDSEVIFAFVDELRQLTPPRELPSARPTVNIVGTGGGPGTFNISTAAAIVASAAGARVLKSGSSAQSSRCGSIDVLRASGIPRPASEDALARMLDELSIGFVSEAHYSPVLRAAAALIQPLFFRDLGRFLNTIGPLLCPFRVDAQLTGVSRDDDFEALRAAAIRLGSPRILFTRAEPGVDELCSFSSNQCQWADAETPPFMLEPREFGFAVGNLSDVMGGDPHANAAILEAALGGRASRVAMETIALNAGALLLVAGATTSLSLGVERALSAILDGSATRQLTRLANWWNR